MARYGCTRAMPNNAFELTGAPGVAGISAMRRLDDHSAVSSTHGR
jgi:hypothetical protein